VLAAGVGALLVHRAAARGGIEEIAVTTGAAGQREDLVLEIEVLDQAGLGQALGDLLGGFVLGLERVHQLQAHQVRQLDHAVVAQAIAVAGPGVGAIDVDKVDRGFHGEVQNSPPLCLTGSQLRAMGSDKSTGGSVTVDKPDRTSTSAEVLVSILVVASFNCAMYLLDSTNSNESLDNK